MINARLKNDVPASRLANIVADARLVGARDATGITTGIGSPIGLLLSLTYAFSSTSLLQSDIKPTGRIFNS